jgi:hypothetical protein
MNSKAAIQLLMLAAILAVGSMWAAGGASAQPVSEHVVLTGYISCTTCLLPNTCKAQTRLGCTEWWVNQGASYVLVVGNTHYRLAGLEKELEKAAAENSVTITGDLAGTDLAVRSVEINHKAK